MGENRDDLGFDNDFLATTTQAWPVKEIIKFDFIKIKTFCSVKVIIKRRRKQAIVRDEIFAKDTSDKELSSKIYKELLRCNNKKKKKNWSKIDQTP